LEEEPSRREPLTKRFWRGLHFTRGTKGGGDKSDDCLKKRNFRLEIEGEKSELRSKVAWDGRTTWACNPPGPIAKKEGESTKDRKNQMPDVHNQTLKGLDRASASGGGINKTRLRRAEGPPEIPKRDSDPKAKTECAQRREGQPEEKEQSKHWRIWQKLGAA